MRNELKHSRKIYFYDNGVRNALINAFNHVESRMDVGALWENYLVAERMKQNAYNQFYGKSHFWRTQQQQEIDYLEDIDGMLRTYEFKWSGTKHPKLSETFAKNYPDNTYMVVNPGNYMEFVTGKI